jgi:hypothetical protein
MNVNRSLDSLELLVSKPRPDISKIQALIQSVRHEFHRLNTSQQELIENNSALLELVRELEDAAKRP